MPTVDDYINDLEHTYGPPDTIKNIAKLNNGAIAYLGQPEDHGLLANKVLAGAGAAISELGDWLTDYGVLGKYAADNLDSTNWDIRSLSNLSKLEEKEKIIYLALELAVKMYEKDKNIHYIRTY